MVGSFGPSAEDSSCLLCKDNAPAGMLARGLYIAKSKFVDDDNVVYLQCEWALKIKKSWE